MNEDKLLQAISALLEKELGAMREEIKEMKSEIKELKVGQKQIREDIANLSFAVGDMMDDKLSALAHELKWTKDATAQNSMDIAVLKKRS